MLHAALPHVSASAAAAGVAAAVFLGIASCGRLTLGGGARAPWVCALYQMGMLRAAVRALAAAGRKKRLERNPVELKPLEENPKRL